jgi:hypothetical protein
MVDTKVICYTGIGSRKNGKHTAKNIKKIAKRNLKNTCKITKNCPKNNNIKGWVKYMGAVYKTPKNCDKIAKPI